MHNPPSSRARSRRSRSRTWPRRSSFRRTRRSGDGAEQRPPRHVREARVSLARARPPDYEIPLAEIILDYYDQLKSRTRGYASFDYDLTGFKPGELVRVDMLVGGEPVDALSLVVHRDFAYDRGRLLVDKLREEIPPDVRHPDPGRDRLARHRARDREGEAEGRAREVLRRRHLAQAEAARKQKAGKKRMKQVGAVEVPQEAFLAVLNIGQSGDGRR